MEEIIGQIERYHQLSIWCLAGMILCGLITWFMYRKMNIREVIGYYRRKKKRKKLWMMVGVCVMCNCIPGTLSYAAEIEWKSEQPEEPEDLPPVLERFYVGTEELLVEYLKDSVKISVCIRDEQTEFDAEKVFLEYRAADTEKWNLFDTKEQIWDNPEDHVFETVYEFNGLENAEIEYEFRITYVDNAENNMVLGDQVQAEKIEACEGTYLAKKQIIIDNLQPSYEVRYQNEMGEELLSAEDGTELSPYYNAAKEVVMDFVIKESYLDMENTEISIIASDLKGKVICEEVPELIEGKFQATLREDGHYLVSVNLVDMAGNKTLHEKKFALDHTPPKQPVITYQTDSQNWLERVWNQLTFGYFSKEKTTAYIQVEDEISELNQVIYSYKEADSEENVTRTMEIVEMPIKVEIPFSFKGNLSIQSEDAVGNQSEVFTHIGVIAESEQTHQKESHAAIQVLTDYSKTVNYYAGDVKLKYSVQDSYSGVKEIDYLAGNQEETASYTEKTEIVTDQIIKEYILSAKENQANNIAVGLNFKDYAGHITSVADDELPIIHIDTISPEIRVLYDNYEAENEKYYKRERNATVYVTEKNFDPDDVSFHILGPEVTVSPWEHDGAAGCQGDHYPHHAGHSSNCVWKCHVKFESDGEYQFGFSCVDLAGNKGDYGIIDEFVIDKTSPVINVTYDNMDVKNEIYYRAPRIAKITIREKNFHPDDLDLRISAENEGLSSGLPRISNWISSNDIHQATISYDYDARFTFDIDYTDLAGNVAADYPGDYFCVDLTNPQIVITEILDKSANNGTVSPVITVTDTNYENRNTWYEIVGWENGLIDVSKVTTQIQNGEMIHIKDFEYVKEADDLYRLTVGSTDLAGNASETRISFSVNRFGSVYTLDKETEKLAGKGGTYYTNVEKELIITETNVDTLEFIDIICNLNGKLRTLVEGKDYIMLESGAEMGWKQYRYQILKENFTEDGHYIITIYSKDRAKNVSDNQSKGKSLSFAVDKSAPSVVVSGVEQKGRYRENSLEIMLDVQDNLAIKEVTAVLDGKPAVYDAKTINALNGKISMLAKGKNTWQTLEIFAKDQAGNQSTIEEITFLVTPNRFIQFYNNKPLFYGSGTLIFAAAIIGTSCLIRNSRKKHLV